MLCRRHHRAVHEGGFALIQPGDGATTFLRPDRTRVLDAVPPLPALSTQIGAAFTELDDIPVWDGTAFDLGYALDISVRTNCGHGHAASSMAEHVDALGVCRNHP